MDGGAGAGEVFLELALGGGDGSGGEVSDRCMRKGRGLGEGRLTVCVLLFRRRR